MKTCVRAWWTYTSGGDDGSGQGVRKSGLGQWCVCVYKQVRSWHHGRCHTTMLPARWAWQAGVVAPSRVVPCAYSTSLALPSTTPIPLVLPLVLPQRAPLVAAQGSYFANIVKKLAA